MTEISFPHANKLASSFFKETRGGTRPQNLSPELRQEIANHFEQLVDIGFGSKGINFNAHGIKRMLLIYSKEFETIKYQLIQSRYGV